MKEVENSNLGSLLVTLSGCALFLFLNVTRILCGTSEIIFNILTNTIYIEETEKNT